MGDLLRKVIAAIVRRPRREPRGGIISGEPIAERAEELLRGFGER